MPRPAKSSCKKDLPSRPYDILACPKWDVHVHVSALTLRSCDAMWSVCGETESECAECFGCTRQVRQVKAVGTPTLGTRNIGMHRHLHRPQEDGVSGMVPSSLDGFTWVWWQVGERGRRVCRNMGWTRNAQGPRVLYWAIRPRSSVPPRAPGKQQCQNIHIPPTWPTANMMQH